MTGILVPTLVGLVLLAIGFLVAWKVPDAPPLAQLALRVVIATGAGFLTYGLSGAIIVGGGWKSLTIRASGGFGVFILVYLVNPPQRVFGFAPKPPTPPSR
jgi:hypothetical protein